MAGAESQRLLDAEAAAGSGQQDAGTGQQAVGERVERRRGEGRGDAPGLGQCGDAIAVAIQAERLRRPRHAQHPGVVGDVGVDAFGKVVQQCIQAAWRTDFCHLLRVRHVQRGIDRLEIVVFRSRIEQQHRLAGQQCRQCRQPNPDRPAAQ